MARKTKKVVLYFFDDGQVAIRATSARGTLLDATNGKICFKPNNEDLGKEIRKVLKNCL